MRRNVRGWLVLLACGALVAGLDGCSDGDDPTTDAGLKKDGLVQKDSGPDQNVAKPDMKKDGTTSKPDMKTDGTTSKPDQTVTKPDQTVAKPDMKTDGPVADMTPDTTVTPPAAEKVIYSVNSSSSAFTLNEVMTDATGQKKIAGFVPNFSLEAMQQTAPATTSYYPTDLVIGGSVRSKIGSEYFIQLQGKLGRMARYWDSTSTVSGYAVIQPSGKIVLPDSSTTNKDGYPYYFGISADGKVAAAAKEGKKLVLLKLDGVAFSGGKMFKDITPSTLGSSTIYDDSVIILKKNLYFVTDDGSSKRSLWTAPADGSKTAIKVPLPTTGGSASTTVYYHPVVNRDRTHVAWLIGSSTTKEDVMVIKDGGTAVNASKKALNLYSPGTGFMDSNNLRIALSKTGKYVTFGTTSSSGDNGTDKSKFRIAATDGTGTPVDVSNGTNFVRSSSSTTNVDTYGSFFWKGDDDLLFWAGTSSNSNDLFHYKVSTKALANLTKTGSATKAPWDGGKWEVDGGWVSQNGAYLYMVAGLSSGTKTSNIIGVNLTTFAKTDITTGLYIDGESNLNYDMETAPGSANVWFVASTSGATTSVEDVYVFNQNTGAKAVNLTKHSSTMRCRCPACWWRPTASTCRTSRAARASSSCSTSPPRAERPGRSTARPATCRTVTSGPRPATAWSTAWAAAPAARTCTTPPPAVPPRPSTRPAGTSPCSAVGSKPLLIVAFSALCAVGGGCGPTARAAQTGPSKTRPAAEAATDYRDRIYSYADDLSALEDIYQATHELTIYVQAIRNSQEPKTLMCPHFIDAVETGLDRLTHMIPKLWREEELETIHPQKRLARLLGKVGNRVCALERKQAGAPLLGPSDKADRLKRALDLDMRAREEELGKNWKRAQKNRLAAGALRQALTGRARLLGTPAGRGLSTRVQRCRAAMDRAARAQAMAEAPDRRRWSELLRLHQGCVRIYTAAIKDMERGLLTDAELLTAWMKAHDQLNKELDGLEKPGDELIDWNILNLKTQLITNIYEVYLLYVSAREGLFYAS